MKDKMTIEDAKQLIKKFYKDFAGIDNEVKDLIEASTLIGREEGREEALKESVVKKQYGNAKDHVYIAFKTLCDTRKLEIKVPESRYLELRDEYYPKIGASFWPEIQKCVNWCYDNNKKKITTSRLRNWLVNAIKFAKEREIRQQQQYQDKKFTPKIQKVGKVWTPPIEEMDDLVAENLNENF